ncbi:hypothetical protein [uncultured Maricaulis sp.]|uniref:hypothetical protein n=1 Tax=uncultured Maricaulis sp. TaxID=174710 RepID=UPI0030DD36EC|tara:strand:+ start:40820 stop:41149 length:330 start_codon:yes stop_codon:yes gene_type:complete
MNKTIDWFLTLRLLVLFAAPAWYFVAFQFADVTGLEMGLDGGIRVGIFVGILITLLFLGLLNFTINREKILTNLSRVKFGSRTTNRLIWKVTAVLFLALIVALVIAAIT